MREGQGFLRFRRGMNVAIEIGAGEGEDRRDVGMRRAQSQQRIMAAPRVKGDEQIARCSAPCRVDVDSIAEAAQDARPAYRRVCGCRCGIPARRASTMTIRLARIRLRSLAGIAELL